MAAKKSVNWTAIKKRYLQGEKPKAIAADFGVTAKAVSDRATKQKWVIKKAQISAKIEEIVEAELESALTSYTWLLNQTAKDIRNLWSQGLMGVTIQNGEALINPLALEANKAGMSMLKKRFEAKIQAQDAKPETQDSKPIEAMDNLEIMDRIKRITGE